MSTVSVQRRENTGSFDRISDDVRRDALTFFDALLSRVYYMCIHSVHWYYASPQSAFCETNLFCSMFFKVLSGTKSISSSHFEYFSILLTPRPTILFAIVILNAFNSKFQCYIGLLVTTVWYIINCLVLLLYYMHLININVIYLYRSPLFMLLLLCTSLILSFQIKKYSTTINLNVNPPVINRAPTFQFSSIKFLVSKEKLDMLQKRFP